MNLQCKHMLSPSSLRLKNNWGTCQEWWGKIWKSNKLCQQLTLEHDTFSLVSGWDILLSVIDLPGLGCFLPSIWSLPRHHDHRSYGSKSYQTSSCVTDMFKSFPSVVTLTSDSLYHPKSFYILLYHVEDVGYIMALLWQGHLLSTSTHYLGSWLRDSLLVPWSLHALMESSSHSMTSSHHWLSIEWFHRCLTSVPLFTFRGLCW